MYKLLSWKGTSLKINNNDDESNCLINILKNEGIDLREDDAEFTLENQPDYYIFENEFINQCKNLLTIITKYSQKNYKKIGKKYLQDSESFRLIRAHANDKKKYEKIIENNIIDGDIRDFNISINVLDEILDNSDKSRLFLDILILFALATKSNYDAESIKSEFIIEDSNFKVEMNIVSSKPIYLYPIYNWIINDEEYEESYNVKLQIVRQVIITKRDIKDIEGILEDSKLAYNRIISKETKEYFEQLNQLKDDFLILSNNENNALRALNLTFFAWIGSLGIKLFNIINQYQGNELIKYLLFSKGAKKGIVILMFIIALFFIFVGYVLEMITLKETYEVIKKIYKDKILFETNSTDQSKFEDIIKKPKIGKVQLIIFLIIIGILIIRLCITFPW